MMHILRTIPPATSPLYFAPILSSLSAMLSAHSIQVAYGELNRAISAHFGSSVMQLTDSGTSALRIAMETCRVRNDGMIALPAYGCFDLLTAAKGSGCNVCFYDINPHTLQPDLESVHSCLNAGANSIIVVHQHGIPADVLTISGMCREYGATLIEDAAQGFGGMLHGKPLGAFGHYVVLSLGRGKGMSGGGGGILLIRAGDGAKAPDTTRQRNLRDLVTAAKVIVELVFQNPTLYSVPAHLPFLGLGKTAYHEPHEPAGLSAFSMVLASRTFERALFDARMRQHTFFSLSDTLAKHGLRTFVPLYDSTPSAIRIPARVAKKEMPTQSRHLGIMRGYPTPLNKLATTRGIRFAASGSLTGAAELCEQLITIPTHVLLKDTDIVSIVNWASRLSRHT